MTTLVAMGSRMSSGSAAVFALAFVTVLLAWAIAWSFMRDKRREERAPIPTLSSGVKGAGRWCQAFIAEHHYLVEEATRISQLSHGRSSGRSKGTKGRADGIREVSKCRIIQETLRHMRLIYVGPAALLSGLLCLVNFFEPTVVSRFWDAVEGLKSTRQYDMTLKLLGYRAAIVTARYLLNVTLGIIFANARADMTQRLRSEMLGMLLSQDMAFYDGVKASELLERLKRDPEHLLDFVTHSLERIFHAVIDLLCGLYLIMNYPWYLCCGSVLLKALPASVISLRAGKTISLYSMVQRHSLAQADAVAAEAFSNLVTVRTHSAEETEQARHGLKAQQYLRVLLHSLYTESLVRSLRFFIWQTMDLGFVILGVVCMVREGMTMGRFLAFKSCMEKFVRGYHGLSDLYTQMTKLKRTSVGYFDLVDHRSSIEPVHDVKQLGQTLTGVGLGHIRIENVSFAYPGRPTVPVLRNVSLEVRPGKMLALCGASGQGKSTIIKLLQRLYDPCEGRITLDGVDIRDFGVRWLRRTLGYVPQEPCLMDCSLLENIIYGLKLRTDVDGKRKNELREGEVTMEDVKTAAQLAQAHDFIEMLPEGYHTSAGAGGVLLSGGQRQRVAIARALVRKPKILLLDEPTSMQPDNNPGATQVALENLVDGGRTVVVIAHRLSTIRKAHMIAVIHEGQVVQMGTHEQLAREEGGPYFRLLQGDFCGNPQFCCD